MLPPAAGTHGAGTPSGGLDTAPEGLTFITDPDTGIRMVATQVNDPNNMSQHAQHDDETRVPRAAATDGDGCVTTATCATPALASIGNFFGLLNSRSVDESKGGKENAGTPGVMAMERDTTAYSKGVRTRSKSLVTSSAIERAGTSSVSSPSVAPTSERV